MASDDLSVRLRNLDRLQMDIENIIRFSSENGLDSIADELRSINGSLSALNFDDQGYLYANPDIAEALGGRNSSAAYTHWLTHGRVEGRIGSGLCPFANRRPPRQHPHKADAHIAFYGPLLAKNGLGEAARGYASALRSFSNSVDIIDTTAALYPDREFPPIARPTTKADIVIIHQNSDALQNFFRMVSPDILDGAYSIGIWVWELSAFNAEWIANFAAFDEIWSPSQFSADAIKCLAPRSLPVVTVPHVVSPPQTKANLGRAHFGIPDDAFAILYAFDASSGMDRKNPEALIEAFSSAFDNAPDVVLVMKCHTTGHATKRLTDIRRAADRGNIVLIDSLLDDGENHSLKEICDAFVSPHRAEGFGLNIAEMMVRGKPVVVTGYSGNLEFCNERNSFLVDYELVEVSDPAGPYPLGYVWASPKHDSLVSKLREVRSESARVMKIASMGRKYIEANLSEKKIAALMAERLSLPKSDERSPLTNQEKKAKYVWRHPLSLSPCREPSISETSKWPLISVIVPVYNISKQYLEACVASVMSQRYPYWELCLCDDASTLPETIDTLERLRGIDHRIRIKRLPQNVGISRCSNSAAEIATGSYLAFVDNDDTISPNALLSYAKAIQANPEAALFYCDEDKISTTGEYVDHYMKPDWSPEHLESTMYVLHMIVVRKSRFLELGGYRERYTGAQDYDLALRISLAGDKVVHVPEVLYHWRMLEGSAAAQVDAKPAALLNARAALTEYAKQKFGPSASVEDGKLTGLFRVTRGRRIAPPVTLVITTNNATKDILGRGRINLVGHLVSSIIDRTDYPNYEIVVVSNGHLDGQVRTLLVEHGHREVHYRYEGQFNFASKANFAFDQARTEIVVLLNDDMEIISRDWLWHLVDYADRSEVGIVGAKLLYPDGRLQHAGVALGVNETAAHLYHGHPGDSIGYNGYPMTIRNYSAVTGACMATKKSVIREVGGFNEEFRIDFNDTDFCLRVREAGYRIVYNPFCELYHFESQTAVRTSQDPAEKVQFLKRWEATIARDPYYNPNLRNDSIAFEAWPSVWRHGLLEN
ncbi:glycosyltransferase [Rhizobium sp. NXC24]|uniref:glycosyltransferase n=1 Tax=Rhizobium sp. NXC24 TaxID=2048897 RepID=UPI000CDF2F4F|nr:glycosyltransferase [Rhizobium sp. NXC24]AVA25744.1 glycosyltransferase family 2 protein [Rhizobium sp. NXC24]